MGGRTIVSPTPAATAPVVLPPLARPKPAFYLAIAFVFVVYARFPEILDAFIGTGLHSARILLMLSLLATLLAGTLIRVAFSKIGFCMLAFTAWMCLSIPFSIWRGGSFNVLRDQWLFSIFSFLIVAAAVQGLEQCRRIMYSLAAATVFIEFCSAVLGRVRYGRAEVLVGTLGNANFLAMMLLMGLPFCLFVIGSKPGFSLLKIACVITAVAAPITIVATGSRGGLLTMLFMFLLYFFRLPASQKILAVVAALALGLIAVGRSNQGALERYKTLMGTSETNPQLSMDERSAMESSQSRRVLLWNSVRMTFEHPLLGVGVGMFQVANARAEEAAGHASWSNWFETHNAFTEISSEMGLPAIILFGAAIYLSFRITRLARRQARRNDAYASFEAPAFALRLSLYAYLGFALFTSIAYLYYFPLLAGLCVALERSLLEAGGADVATAPASAGPAAPAGRRAMTR